MDKSGLGRLSTELIEHLSQYAEPRDLLSFRLTCSRANAGASRVFGRCFFSSWTTSLMGTDLERLEAIAENITLRRYIKTICIEDGSERSAEFPPPRTSIIWSRESSGTIGAGLLGVANIRRMLLNKTLQPDSLIIRDYRDNGTCAGIGPSASLAEDITDGVDLAITSIKLSQTTSVVAEAILELSAEHQGQSVGFSLLRSAHLSHSKSINTYWPEKALYHASALEDLRLSLSLPGAFQVITPEGITGLSTTEQANFSLKRLELYGECFEGAHIMWLLSNSWQSLTHIFLNGCRMSRPFTWREMLTRVGNECPKLASFELRFLKENSADGVGKVDFVRLSPESFDEQYRDGLGMQLRGRPGQERLTRVTYEGVGAGEVLKKFAAAIEYIH